jgi:hypothetical protein
MDSRGFWSLFAETGEPLYWLLSRAQERQPRREERPAPEKRVPPEEAPRPKL